MLGRLELCSLIEMDTTARPVREYRISRHLLSFVTAGRIPTVPAPMLITQMETHSRKSKRDADLFLEYCNRIIMCVVHV